MADSEAKAAENLGLDPKSLEAIKRAFHPMIDERIAKAAQNIDSKPYEPSTPGKTATAGGRHARADEAIPYVTGRPGVDRAIAPVMSVLPSTAQRVIQAIPSPSQAPSAPPTMQLTPTAPTNFGTPGMGTAAPGMPTNGVAAPVLTAPPAPGPMGMGTPQPDALNAQIAAQAGQPPTSQDALNAQIAAQIAAARR